MLMLRLALHLGALVCACAALASQPQGLVWPKATLLRTRCSVDCSNDEWDKRELWALEDSVPRYSLEDGELVLWRRMTLEVPELITRTPDELRSRWLALQSAAGAHPVAAANPPSLENWEASRGGKFEGEIFGVQGVRDGSVRAVVRGINATASSVYSEAARWCVRTSGGDLFQLGVPRRSAEASEDDESLYNCLLAAGMHVGETTEGAGSSLCNALGGLGQSSAGLFKVVAVGLSTPILLGAAVYTLIAASGHHVDVNIFIV